MALPLGALPLNPPDRPESALPGGAPELKSEPEEPYLFKLPFEGAREPHPGDPEPESVRRICCACGRGRSGIGPIVPLGMYLSSKSRATFIRGVSFATRKSPIAFMRVPRAVFVSLKRGTRTSLP